jgi:arginyl-tRNA synthetase
MRCLGEQVDEVLRLGSSYGSLDLGAGQTVQVEYVQRQPTGPLHMGSARNAVLGDTLASCWPPPDTRCSASIT